MGTPLKKFDLNTNFDSNTMDFRICYAEKAFWMRRPLKQEELHVIETGRIELPPQIILSPTAELRKKNIEGFSNKIVVITPDVEEAQIVDIFTTGEDDEEEEDENKKDPIAGLIWIEAMFPIQSIEVTDVTIVGED